MFVSHGSKKLKALSVIPPSQCRFRRAEVQRFRLIAHASTASHHHGADAGVGEDFEQEGMGNPAINDVGG